MASFSTQDRLGLHKCRFTQCKLVVAPFDYREVMFIDKLFRVLSRFTAQCPWIKF